MVAPRVSISHYSRTMGATRALLCLLMVAGFGCVAAGDEPPHAATEQVRPPAEDALVRGKPTAPIAVRMTATRLDGSTYRITVAGTPETDVDYVLLRLLLPDGVTADGAPLSARFEKTRAGTTRTLTARVSPRASGARVRASARVGVAPGIEPNRMAEVTIGAPPPSPRRATHTVILPSGDRLDEVGP